jgi:hypothetical protein
VIEVYYLEAKPELYEGPFLAEEPCKILQFAGRLETE